MSNVQKQTDIVILTDLTGQGIGEKEKIAAHQTPCLHRAFSVFIYHQNQMLIQQRALDKYHSGGLWANTCCSHPRPGEDTKNAAIRRLQEETGIFQPHLKEIFAFPYYHQFGPNLFEYEFDHVFLGEYTPYQDVDQIPFDPKEIAALRWVPFSALLTEMQQNPQYYAPWFHIAAPLVIQYLKKQTLS